MRRLDIPAADVIVIGSGPNGLSAAIVAAQAGCSVNVLEAEEQIGGSARSAELTLPGFVHDVCSAVYPMAVASPFFRTLPLAKYGLEWIHPELPLAHPLDDGSAAVLARSIDATAASLGADGNAYRRLMEPLVELWDDLLLDLLRPPGWPRDVVAFARFGMNALRPAQGLAKSRFRHEPARALFAGLAGHSVVPLHKLGTSAFGLVLGAAGHAAGWPFARGGAQQIADALAAHLQTLGGHIFPGMRVHSLDQLPPARAFLCDVTPRQLVALAGDRLPPWFRSKLGRYRYGMAAFKVDWALDGPIPWKAEACTRAGTIHVGGTLEEIAASENDAWQDRLSERPFVLLAQPTLFDPARAPAGKHIAWAYCHVPNGSTADMTARIEAQVERFAPGFRRRIIARSVRTPAQLEQHNATLVGGDINGGAADIRQLFLRPTLLLYGTPTKGIYLCSASTPPGGGVHGMCGFFAAHLALHEMKA